MTPALTPQLIGQTEKTMNAILERLLAGRVTEPEWVVLVLLASRTEVADANQLSTQLAAALKVDQPAASAHLDALDAKGLIEVTHGFTALTASGRKLLDEVRAETTLIVQRLWGDLPPQDLNIAARVLTTALERAEIELRAG